MAIEQLFENSHNFTFEKLCEAWELFLENYPEAVLPAEEWRDLRQETRPEVQEAILNFYIAYSEYKAWYGHDTSDNTFALASDCCRTETSVINLIGSTGVLENLKLEVNEPFGDCYSNTPY
jgi:hypothetical protein